MRTAMGDEFKVSFNDIILKATATALAQHPEVLDDGLSTDAAQTSLAAGGATPASIATANVLLGLATDRHTFSTKARVRTKHTAGAALTSQTVADGNSNRPFGGCCGELPATAGCFV